MEIVIDGVKFTVHVIRGRARHSVSAKFLNEHELELRIPQGMSEPRLHEFLKNHRRWLERARRRQSRRKRVFHNSRMLFNGEYLSVEHVESPEPRIEPIGSSIFVHSSDILALKDTLSRWLEEQTRRYLGSKQRIFKQFGVRAVRVSYSKNRWGFCSAKREITFHPFLAALPEHLREYLIYHEIAHLYELNHSWRYKAKLRELVPDYKEREKELRVYSL